MPHGFRPSFRDWAAECSDAPREVCELALAHVNASSIEAAYRRTDMFERRRALMEQWAAFLAGTKNNVAWQRGWTARARSSRAWRRLWLDSDAIVLGGNLRSLLEKEREIDREPLDVHHWLSVDSRDAGPVSGGVRTLEPLGVGLSGLATRVARTGDGGAEFLH